MFLEMACAACTRAANTLASPGARAAASASPPACPQVPHYCERCQTPTLSPSRSGAASIATVRWTYSNQSIYEASFTKCPGLPPSPMLISPSAQTASIAPVTAASRATATPPSRLPGQPAPLPMYMLLPCGGSLYQTGTTGRDLPVVLLINGTEQDSRLDTACGVAALSPDWLNEISSSGMERLNGNTSCAYGSPCPPCPPCPRPPPSGASGLTAPLPLPTVNTPTPSPSIPLQTLSETSPHHPDMEANKNTGLLTSAATGNDPIDC
eukprot:gene3724-4135_t